MTRIGPAATRVAMTSTHTIFRLTDCLKDTVARFLPYWHDAIAPAVKSGVQVIIAEAQLHQPPAGCCHER